MTPFELAEPTSFSEAVRLLDPEDPTIRAISGGTALMLMMKSGVFHPSRLVSLKGVEDAYRRVAFEAKGGLTVGAMTPLSVLERSQEVARHFPVLADTLHVLSNRRVRNVATIGGSLAHADPHMDLPPVLLALDAQITAIGPSGDRTVPIEDLFVGYYETSLALDELIDSVRVPAQKGRVSAYVKCTTRAAHDWPALGVAVSLEASGGTIRDARVVISAATETPTRMTDAEAALEGASVGEEAFRAAGDAAAARAEVISDVRGSAPYKKQLIRVHVARALAKAIAAADCATADWEERS